MVYLHVYVCGNIMVPSIYIDDPFLYRCVNLAGFVTCLSGYYAHKYENNNPDI